MRAIQVTENIWWVGAIDWGLRDFHGFDTPRGTTYSAYLVRGETGTALIDTTKKAYVPELLARVSSVMDPAEVTHIVVNHVEPDHNGGLPEVMAAMPRARVVASKGGVNGVADYHDGLAIEAVGPTDVIDLGGRTLSFLPLPMVHWPDSMFTYCPEERVLMPNDAFGQHVASDERWSDEFGLEDTVAEAHRYYANILMPLGLPVGKAIAKVVDAGWAIDVIAPSHGLMWRGEGIGRILGEYGRWSAGEKRDKALVIYTTMWGSTDMLARRVADGMAAAGLEVEVFDLAVSTIGDITDALLDAKAVAFGSSTLHHGMLFRMASYLQYLSGLKPTGVVAGLFGSYGWSKGAEKQMRERVEAMGIELPFDDFLVKAKPTAVDLEAAESWGRSIAEAVLAGE